MTRLILALLASALSQDVADPSGKVALPYGLPVPMLATSTASPTEKEFVHEDKSNATSPTGAEFDDVTWTSSLLLIGFVIASMGILCLVNYHDKHIRKESWAFLGTTVSIFSAASFDFAVYRLLEFFLGIDEHDSAHDMAKQCRIVIFLILWCLLVFVILHALLLNYSGQRILFAFFSLGSHIYAFASILVFGTMQKWDLSFKGIPWVWVWSIPFLAFVVMFLLYGLMLLMFTGRENQSQMSEKGEQLKTAIEVHIDASAISVAFLLVQALCHTMSMPDQPHEKQFMPITNGSPGQHSPYAWLKLFVCAFFLNAFSSIWACLNSKRKCCHVCTDFIGENAADFIKKLASVTGSWCLQRGGMLGWFYLVSARMRWYLNKRGYPDTTQVDPDQSTHRAQILNAYVMSICAIVFVIVMDKIADWFEEDEDDSHYHSAAFGLRSVMSGLGVLVGICWDKAFETAYETILEERSIDNLMGTEDKLYKWIHENKITAHLCTAAVGITMSVLVALAWYRFIVPHAMKKTKHHKKEIKMERRTYATLDTPKSTPRSPLSASESSSEDSTSELPP